MDQKLILIFILILFILSDCKEVCRILKIFNEKCPCDQKSKKNTKETKEKFSFNEYNYFQSKDQDKYDICKYADSLRTCKNFLQQMGPNANLARIGSILNIDSKYNKFFPVYSYYDRRLEKNRYLIKDYTSPTRYIWRQSDSLPDYAEEGSFVDLGNGIKGRFVRKEGKRNYHKVGYIQKTDGTKHDLYENQNYYDPTKYKYFVTYDDAIVTIHNKRKLKDGDIVMQMTLGKINIVINNDLVQKNEKLKIVDDMKQKINEQNNNKEIIKKKNKSKKNLTQKMMNINQKKKMKLLSMKI